MIPRNLDAFLFTYFKKQRDRPTRARVIIFYNGVDELPEQKILTLSALYEKTALERVEADLGILAEFLSRNKTEAKKVSIYEYDEEKHMRMEREASFEDGLRQGEERGLKKGQELKLFQIIEKKLAKGKPIPQIAEELEESVDLIEKLINEKDN